MSLGESVLEQILRGNSDANVRFNDLRGLLLRLGFAERVKGDHHIFTRECVAEILNFAAQEIDGKTVPSEAGT